MSDPLSPVECGRHGDGHETFVCRHLARGQGRGFFSAETPGDTRPDAWCFECEQVLTARGHWDEETEALAGVTLVCSGCYDEARHCNGETRPSLDIDGWCFGTRYDVLFSTPDHTLPSREAVEAVPIGDFVKALFFIVGKRDDTLYVQGERMWVLVDDHSDGCVHGELASDPETDGALAEGARIDLPYENVIDLYDGD